MADILDYIDWRGDLSFESAQFNSVDNLIFSALSYINFSTYVSQDFSNPISFRELLPAFKTKTKSQEQELGLFINKKTFDLFLKRQNQNVMEAVLYKLMFKYSMQKVKHSFLQQALLLDINNTASHTGELMIAFLDGKRTSICPLWKQYLHKLKR